MSISGRQINTVGELIQEVVRVTESSWSPVWFRGQADAAWALRPKVQRNALELDSDDSYEKNLVHRFRGRAPLLGAQIDTANNAAWLQVMQHHGLPTRLLDWSRSPLIAAYFAVEGVLRRKDEKLRDAAIWCLDPHGLNRFTTVEHVSFTPSVESGHARGLIDGAFYGDPSARESATVRRRDWQSKVSAGAEVPNWDVGIDHPDHLAVMSNESDIRMFVQQGAFTIHSFGSQSLELLDCAHEILRKLVIPKDQLRAFSREVEASGFGEAGVYPDLDHLSAELARTGADVGHRQSSLR